MERYRLAPMRDVRALDERAKRGNLADSVADARATEGLVAAAAAREQAARTALAEAMRAPAQATAAQLAAADRHRAWLRGRLADARAALDRARAAHDGRLAEVDAARMGLARARADREVIERHFAAWRQAQARVRERRNEE